MEYKNTAVKKTVYGFYDRYISEGNTPEKAIELTIHALQCYFSASNKTNEQAEKKDIYQKTIFHQFIQQAKDQTLVKRFPSARTQLLSNSIVQTNFKYFTSVDPDSGDRQVIFALQKLINQKSYDGFTRSEHARQNIQDNFSPAELEHFILFEYIDEALLERQQTVADTMAKQAGPKVKNLNINPTAFNHCREDILKNQQISFARQNYSLENMQASIDVGRNRRNQEDAVLLLTHPDNPKFKLLLVADGCGGHGGGEIASNYVATQMMQWFEQLDPRFYEPQYTEQLQQAYNEALYVISNNLEKEHPGCLSTYVGAIVNKTNTILSNIGDSRAYACCNGQLVQVSKDHSFAYQKWETKEIPDKDAIRFHRKSNLITNSMGRMSQAPYSTTFPNNAYQTLLLFSDGVTDCLSDEQIKAITASTPKHELAKALVDVALTTDSHRRFNSPDYVETIRGGKDNTTAAVIDNER